ncbi:10175_t:CDS:2, partial [Racocetra persica]
MTKKDGGEYKAKTVKQAINGINRYISKTGAIRGLNLHDKYQFPDLYDILNGKMKDLQERGFGEKERSIALTAQQLPPDLSDIPGPVSDFTKYISKHPLGASDNFYLQPNPNWRDTNIWYLKTHCDLNRVGNFMRDIGQKVKDADIPEDVIMNITRHRSSQGLCVYKTVNENQKVNTMKTLINTMEPASNTNMISQESPTVLTKITGSQINFNTNTVTTQDINI